MPATINPASGALGNKETATLTAYTVTPEAGSTVTQIVEKVNGVTVNTFNNPASLSRTLTVPTATWDTLAYFATHTASVTVTDSNGAQTVTTYSFDKRLTTGASLLEATKANTDAKNRISQKRDALAAQVGLSAGSTFDAISAQLASGAAFKKFASGTVNSSSTTLNFTDSSGGTLSSYHVTVNGLGFTPQFILIKSRGGTTGVYTIFDNVNGFSDTFPDWKISSGSNYYTNTTAGLNARGYKLDGTNSYVNSSSFRMPINVQSTNCTWLAFG